MATCGGGGSWAAGIVRLLQSLGRRSALAVVALRDVRRCLSSTTLRDYCAGRHITTWRRQHDVHGRRRRPGRATNLQDSDEAATAGRRGIDVKFLCTQVLPSRYTPCISLEHCLPQKVPSSGGGLLQGPSIRRALAGSVHVHPAGTP